MHHLGCTSAGPGNLTQYAKQTLLGRPGRLSAPFALFRHYGSHVLHVYVYICIHTCQCIHIIGRGVSAKDNS